MYNYINPFLFIRLLLYTFFRIESVAVLKKDTGTVHWYYVRKNGLYFYIYTVSQPNGPIHKLCSDGKLVDIAYPDTSCTFTDWKPLFTFWNKKKELRKNHISSGNPVDINSGVA